MYTTKAHGSDGLLLSGVATYPTSGATATAGGGHMQGTDRFAAAIRHDPELSDGSSIASDCIQALRELVTLELTEGSEQNDESAGGDDDDERRRMESTRAHRRLFWLKLCHAVASDNGGRRQGGNGGDKLMAEKKTYEDAGEVFFFIYIFILFCDSILHYYNAVI